MGMYNILHCDVVCPHCGARIHADAEFRFGFLDLANYQIGDRLAWADKNGKGLRYPKIEPQGGNFVDVGYVECDVCKQSFFIDILIEKDVITGVRKSDRNPNDGNDS